MNPNFITAVQRLHPGVSFRRDVIVQDNSDGSGPFLVAWNLPGNPLTDAEIAAAIAIPLPPVDPLSIHPTWGDLVKAGVATAAQVPTVTATL